MGMMPESECKRRNTKEYPSPARSGATPLRMRVELSIELADEATKLTPYECSPQYEPLLRILAEQRMSKLTIIEFAEDASQESDPGVCVGRIA